MHLHSEGDIEVAVVSNVLEAAAVEETGIIEAPVSLDADMTASVEEASKAREKRKSSYAPSYPHATDAQYTPQHQ